MRADGHFEHLLQSIVDGVDDRHAPDDEFGGADDHTADEIACRKSDQDKKQDGQNETQARNRERQIGIGIEFSRNDLGHDGIDKFQKPPRAPERDRDRNRDYDAREKITAQARTEPDLGIDDFLDILSHFVAGEIAHPRLSSWRVDILRPWRC